MMSTIVKCVNEYRGSGMHDPSNAVHDPPNAVHDPPNAVHDLPVAEHDPPTAVHGPPVAVHYAMNCVAMGSFFIVSRKRGCLFRDGSFT